MLRHRSSHSHSGNRVSHTDLPQPQPAAASPTLRRKRQAIQRGRQSFEQSLAVLDALFGRSTPYKADR
jgi:hypothetical protein